MYSDLQQVDCVLQLSVCLSACPTADLISLMVILILNKYDSRV